MAAPMEFHVRVKVFFENFAVQPTWLLVDQNDTKTIKKLCKIIYKNFIGEKTRLELYLEGCRVPLWESTKILHDNDMIFVRASERIKNDQRISPIIFEESESRQHTKKKKKISPPEETEKSHKKGNIEENKHEKPKETKKRKLDEDTPIGAGNSRKSQRRIKNFSVGHLLQNQILGKNVSFSTEPNVTNAGKDETQCTDDVGNDNQRVDDSHVDKEQDKVKEDDKSGGDATPNAVRRRKRKRSRRRRKPLEKQNDSSVSGLRGGEQKSIDNQLEIIQSWIDPAPVNVKPPRTFRVDQKTYNSVGSYKKFESDDEFEGNVKDTEMEVSMVSSTPKELQVSVKDSNLFTSENRHQNNQMKVLSYSSDFQQRYNNNTNSENWKEKNYKTKSVNRTFDDSRVSQNGEMQESNSSEVYETWQWGRGTNYYSEDFANQSISKDSQCQEENTENSEPEIVKSVLANGVAVYTRRRNPGRRSYTELSKAQQLNTRLTNKSVILKNSETVPESKAAPKQSSSSSSASSSSSSSEDSSDEEAVTNKSSQRQASNAEDSKVLKLIPVFRDYSRFPPLNGPPRQGDTIAYKMLEMSSNYTPEVSDYKEASVVKYNSDMKTVELKLLQQCSKKDISGKFEIDIEEDEDFTMNSDLNEAGNLTLQWASLLDPRLVTD